MPGEETPPRKNKGGRQLGDDLLDAFQIGNEMQSEDSYKDSFAADTCNLTPIKNKQVI